LKSKIIYIVTVVISVCYIFIGNYIATKDLTAFEGANESDIQKAVITEIVDRTAVQSNIEGAQYSSGVNIRFRAKFLSGENKGTEVIGIQNSDPSMISKMKEVEQGDKILLMEYDGADPDGEAEWMMIEYVRSDALIGLTGVFFLLLLLFGRKKGVNTILSMVFTCLAIFIIYIPAILSGQNIYLWSAITSVFIIAMTMLLINGATAKSLAAALGCASGVIITGGLSFIMDGIIHLTGLVDEDSYYLFLLNQDNPIDLKAIVFGAIIIGAIGALMDVAMDIAASLREVASNMENPTFSSLVKSGITIGRDIIGTMANTLVLAYIGSSLSLVLLLAAYNNSIIYLLNREMVVVEILQALAGSVGILFTIPFTSVICGLLYVKSHPKIELKLPKAPEEERLLDADAAWRTEEDQ